MKNYRAEPDAFDLDLSFGEVAVIIVCSIAFGVLVSL